MLLPEEWCGAKDGPQLERPEEKARQEVSSWMDSGDGFDFFISRAEERKDDATMDDGWMDELERGWDPTRAHTHNNGSTTEGGRAMEI
jgi:hypothetical protein